MAEHVSIGDFRVFAVSLSTFRGVKMILRNPTQLEVERAGDVAWIAFGNNTQEHWRESFTKTVEMFGPRFIVVVEMDGGIVSALLCHPAPVYFGEQSVSHSSVGAVATLPEYRKRGCAAAMMTRCVEILSSENICLSSLWPFSFPYYRKFGWEVGAERRIYSAKGGFFSATGEPNTVREAALDDFDAVAVIYDRFKLRYNCLSRRSRQWWERVCWIDDYLKPESGHGAAVHAGERGTDGYVLYTLASLEDACAVQIRELVFDQLQTRRDLLAYLGRKFPDSELEFDTPVNDLFLHEIPDPRAVHVAVTPSFSFRVVDPKGAILALKADESVSGRMSFKISDPVFEAGHTFGIEVENGCIRECKPSSSNVCEMDVRTFAKLYSGYLAPGDARLLEACKMSDKGAGGTGARPRNILTSRAVQVVAGAGIGRQLHVSGFPFRLRFTQIPKQRGLVSF